MVPSKNAAVLLELVLAHLKVAKRPDARGEYTCWCPFHPDGQGAPPHRPNLLVSERGYFCNACGAKGGLRDLAERLGLETRDGRDGPRATYDYRDEQGHLLYQVCRFHPKEFRQRRPAEGGGWRWSVNGVRHVLYRLPELIANPQLEVYIAEGEKDADALAMRGFIATTNSGGAGKWRAEYSHFLLGRNVIILADNDDPGREHAQKVARALVGTAARMRVLELPGLETKGDVSDWLRGGHTAEELQDLARQAPDWRPEADLTARRQEGDERQPRQKSQADRLVALVQEDGLTLFHDEFGTGFARVPVDSHSEVWRCRSKDFKRWLAQRFWQTEEKAPGSEALASALNVIEAMAHFQGEEHPLHNRVARLGDAIWYDLADPGWRAVRIDRAGWEVVADPPLLFRRYAHEQAQVEPIRNGDLRQFLDFVNLHDAEQGLLLLAYLVSCYVPDIPHPIPLIHGPQGSAKTTLFRMLRRLVDPSSVEILSFPRDPADLVQQLSHHWAPYYDNLSDLPAWISDLLCRAVTGEGFSKRELYTDDEDVIYRFRRCVGLNGINIAAKAPDLLDRCLLFGLDSIDPSSRQTEQSIWRSFHASRPGLLGAVFDTLSDALGRRDSVELTAVPRMADFAYWGCAVAGALGRTRDQFVSAYEANSESRNEEALEASPVAILVVELMRGRDRWEGTSSRLLAELEDLASCHRVGTQGPDWPKAAHVLSRRLNMVKPNLAAAGIEVTSSRGERRTLTICHR